MNEQEAVNKKLELVLFIVILLLLSANSLGTAVLTGFTNASWEDMGTAKRVLMFVAILTNWTGVMIALFNRGFAKLMAGKPITSMVQGDFETQHFAKPPVIRETTHTVRETRATSSPIETTSAAAAPVAVAEPTKGTVEMKQTTVTDIKNIPGVVLPLLAALLLASSAFGQATNAPPAATPPTVTSALSDLFSAISYDKTNWVYEVHGMYAPALQGKYGGGLGAFYPISKYVFTGIRLDYVDGGFYMPSGSAGLQLPITPVSWLTIKPFAYAGIGIPLAGATVGNFSLPGHPNLRDNNGQATAILGIGAAVSLYTSKSGKYSLELVGDRENWSGFAGQQYRAGLLVHVLF